jgi:hypothetical protein
LLAPVMDLEYQYLVARLQEALARDPRVGVQDIKVNVIAGRIHLIGDVPSEARRGAVDAVVREVLADEPRTLVRNELRVIALGATADPEPIE